MRLSWLPLLLLPLAVAPAAAAPTADNKPAADKAASAEPAKKKPKIDRSGKKQRGKASYYSRRFAGKPMADGTPMNPESNVAASRTLPLGTKAKVTNLENGKSAVVEIRDRGPYVEGRTIDLTPRTARELDFIEDGVVPVEVVPIELPDDSSKGGATSG